VVLGSAPLPVQRGLTESLSEARRDREFWGRLVESAVGAHLANAAAAGECEVFYWRDRNAEVDFVVRAGRSITALEVKSGRAREGFPSLAAFGAAVPKARKLVVGAEGVSVEEFLRRSALHWVTR
jgi:Holliday junction resolvase-like predicted endonuclease